MSAICPEDAKSPSREASMDVRLVVHDMRAPLNAVLLSLQTLPLLGDLNPDQEHAVAMAEKNARALTGLIEDLLATAKGNGWSKESLSLRECRVGEIIEDAMNQMSPLAIKKGIFLKSGPTETLPLFRADHEKVTRVLVNLISNALKFTESGGHVTIEVKSRVNDGHPVLVFSVIDDGTGVSEEDANRIFVEGISIAGTSGERSTGLGLAVSMQIIEAHGGRIWVETGRERGSVFSFSIPLES